MNVTLNETEMRSLTASDDIGTVFYHILEDSCITVICPLGNIATYTCISSNVEFKLYIKSLDKGKAVIDMEIL